MFAFDPIDLADPSPYLAISYYSHIAIGSVALLAALSAFAVTKGGTIHRRAGWVFFAAVAVVCASSLEMLANVFIAPLFMAVFTAIYAVAGAWLALQRGTMSVRVAEIALLAFELVGLVVFLSIAIPAARAGLIPIFAPLVIVVIPAILIAGDINWIARPAWRNRLRIARHLNRMVWAFIVVLRAPLVELAAAGVPIPGPVAIVGPVLLGVAMLAYFNWRYARPKRA